MQPNMAKNQLTSEQITEVLDKATWGTLSTVGADGYPYGAPVNIVRVGDVVYFHGRRMGEKVDNIARDPKVCLTVVEENGFEDMGPDSCDSTTIYRSVIIRGKAERVTDPDTCKQVLVEVVRKLTPEKFDLPMNEKKIAAAAIFAIRAESCTGKFHMPMPGNRVMGAHKD